MDSLVWPTLKRINMAADELFRGFFFKLKVSHTLKMINNTFLTKILTLHGCMVHVKNVLRIVCWRFPFYQMWQQGRLFPAPAPCALNSYEWDIVPSAEMPRFPENPSVRYSADSVSVNGDGQSILFAPHGLWAAAVVDSELQQTCLSNMQPGLGPMQPIYLTVAMRQCGLMCCYVMAGYSLFKLWNHVLGFTLLFPNLWLYEFCFKLFLLL